MPDRGPFGPFDRPRVEVRHSDGRWYPGRLHGWVRDRRGWQGVVTYGTAPGIQHYACLAAGALRRLDDPGDQGDPGDEGAVAQRDPAADALHPACLPPGPACLDGVSPDDGP